MTTSSEIDDLKIIHGYGKIIHGVFSNLSKTNIRTKLADYKRKKLELLDQGDVPDLIRKDQINTDAFRIANTIFLKQSEILSDTAKNSDDVVKPILYYYAEQSLFAFFLYSIFSYDEASKHHGLIVNSKSINEISVTILKHGFFQRIVDAYSVFEAGPIYSPIIFENSGFIKNDKDYSIINKTEFTLDELIKIQQNNDNVNGNHKDITDYLLMFVASFLARYKPAIWNEILEAKRTDYITYFRKCFDRFDVLYKRLLLTLLLASHNHSIPASLQDFDIQIDQKWPK